MAAWTSVSWRRGRVVVPSLVAGLLLALSVPPFGWWPLAFGGAAVLFWRLEGLRWRTRLGAGWVAGMGCFVPGLWWAASFNWYGAVVLMAVEALSMAVAAALVPARRWRLGAYAGAFTLLEAVRLSWPFGGLPLGGVFLGQADGPLLETARVGGPLLLTALVWTGGAALCELVLAAATGAGIARGSAARLPGARRGASRGAAGALGVVTVAAVAVAGALAPAGGPPTRRITVALVQGGGRRGVSQRQVTPSTVFEAQVAASAALLHANSPPALVVWPEDVIRVGAHLEGTPQAAYVSALARRLRATVVAGVTETISSRAFRNEAVAWGPSGRIVGTYEKNHRVPFGEYVPYRSFFSHFANLSAVPLDAVPGHGPGFLATPAAPLGVMISFEVFFASRGRAAVRAGAQLLVVPTNTSSYATTQVPQMELAADRLQAVAEGRDLAQAAPTGYSSVLDANGAVVERSALGRRQVLRATVALRTGRTIYAQLGDLPVLVLAALALGAGITGSALGERRLRRLRRLRRRWHRAVSWRPWRRGYA